MTNNNFIKSGGLLFFEQSIVNFGNSIFWLIVSQFVFASDIGEAISILSLVMLFTTVIQMGIEYPLLKHSHDQPKIMSTSLLIELIFSLASIPIFMFLINNVLGYSNPQVFLIALGILLMTPLAHVLRFSLLGVSKIKNVLIIFVIATIIKLISVYLLLLNNLESLGILFAFLLFTISIIIPSFLVSLKHFGLGFQRMVNVWEHLKTALVNAPSKIRPLTRYLVVFLLPVFGIEESLIGIFYIALIISWVVGSLSTSFAFMVIPASTKAKTDLSGESMRLGLGLTSPIIVALMIAPDSILSLIGSVYTLAGIPLFFLSLSIIPYIVTVNSISKFNNLNQIKKITFVGIFQTIILIVSFVFLVPDFGILGAAFSILLANSFSAILCLNWSNRQHTRYAINTVIAVTMGWISGYLISLLFSNFSPLAIIVGMIITFLLILGFKTLSLSEITSSLKMRSKIK